MLEDTDNLILPFQLESSSLRGRLSRMGDVLDLILRQHDYPDSVARLLAEAMVIASVLASSLKYEGVFTLQAKGDGAVRLLVADVTNDGGVRGYAQFDKEKLGDAAADAKLIGKGFLAFTCTLLNREDRYQGIVALEGGTLAEAVQHYFRQSEQVPTGIMTAVDRDAQGHWRGGCLLVQRMPRQGGVGSDGAAVSALDVESSSSAAEDWTRAMMVMGTCTPQELTDVELPAEDLLYRLFHEEGVRVFDSLPLRHQCRCSQVRVEGMLRSLPRAEVETLTIKGRVVVTCEFCNMSYAFSEKDLDALYQRPNDLT